MNYQQYTTNQLIDLLKGKWLKATLTRQVTCCGEEVNLFAEELYFVVDLLLEFEVDDYVFNNVIKLIAQDGKVFHYSVGTPNNLKLPDVGYWYLVSPEEESK